MVLPAPIAVLSAQRKPRQPDTSAFAGAVLDHLLDDVWSLIRDIVNYLAYIDAGSESLPKTTSAATLPAPPGASAISETGSASPWIDHPDQQHTLTYAGLEALPHPQEDGSLATQLRRRRRATKGTMPPRPITEGDRTLIEWSLDLETEPRGHRSPAGAVRPHGSSTGRIHLRGRWSGPGSGS